MPVLGILHVLRFERFVLPSPDVFVYLISNALFGTVLSDLLWAKSMLLTSPLIATLGLSFTIPLAILQSSLISHKLHLNAIYLLGAAFMIAGFFAVNWHYQISDLEESHDTIVVPQHCENQMTPDTSGHDDKAPLV